MEEFTEIINSRSDNNDINLIFSKLVGGRCIETNLLQTGLLTKEQIELHRTTYGSNTIPLPKPPSFLILAFIALKDPTLIILLVAAFVSFIFGQEKSSQSSVEGISILLTVVLVVMVQAVTNYLNATAFIKQQMELENRKIISCLRNGEWIRFHPKELVVGDIILVKIGNVIPADGIVIEGQLDMDESALTGENELHSITRGSIIVSGTNVIRGEGLVLILAVGPWSVSGKIRAAIVEEENGKNVYGRNSVLFEKLDHLAMKIGNIGILIAVFIFFTLLIHWWFFCIPKKEADELICHKETTTINESFQVILDFFILSVSILVMAVPEGLPLAVTLALAVSIKRLEKDGIQVKKIESCETMGSATTICSDKTGTLTENKMKVVNYFYQHSELFSLCCALIVSKDSKLIVNKDDAQFTYEGNPTDCAILRFCLENLKVDYGQIQRNHMLNGSSNNNNNNTNGYWGMKLNPFSSERKMMSLWISSSLPNNKNEKNELIMLCKGAPTVVLDKCSHYFENHEKIMETNSEFFKQMHAMIGIEEQKARRVVAFAIKFATTTDQQEEEETKLIFLGWVSMQDPLRENVTRSVELCSNAGIVVRMITGDSLLTAKAVAKECGILREHNMDDPEVSMTGAEFTERILKIDRSNPNLVRRRTFTEGIGEEFRFAPPFLYENGSPVIDFEKFDQLWPKIRVLARCLPEDKLRFVKGIKTSSLMKPLINPQVIAVTGDGTNDAPCLKASDIGFAMGIAGTEVCKQAADAIVLDDSFHSIVRALIWGRNVHDSVCKFLQFQVTVNVSACILASFGSLWMHKSPFNATQFLWVNMIMDSFGSVALATLNPEKESVLNRPPIPRNEFVVSLSMAANIVGQSIIQILICIWLQVTLEGWCERKKKTTKDGSNDEEKLKIENLSKPTFIFNTFVLFQLFNLINCKSITGNNLERINSSFIFNIVLIGTLFTQICIVQFEFFNCHSLSLSEWVNCFFIAILTMPWQLIFVDRLSKVMGKKDWQSFSRMFDITQTRYSLFGRNKKAAVETV